MDAFQRVSEVAKQINVNHNTLRRWLLQYDEFLITRKDRKMKYIHTDSIKTLLLIKQYYDEAKKEHEIIDLLSSNPEVIRNVDAEELDDEQMDEDAEQEEGSAVPVPADLIERVKQELINEVAASVERQLEERFKRFDERMAERDKLLMESIRTIQEIKQEKKKGFWDWLFRR